MNNLIDLIQNSSSKIIGLSQYEENMLHEVTFDKINQWSTNVAYELKKKGLPKNSNIALFGKNSIEWIVSFFGIIKAGFTCVPIDSKLNFNATNNIIRLSDSLFSICDNNKKIRIEGLSFQDIRNISNDKREINFQNIDPNDIAIILFTSGTTGNPKGVMLSHNNIISNLYQIKSKISLSKRLRTFSILPLSHVYELTCNILLNISLKNKIHFCSSLDLKTMTKELKAFKPNIFPVVPLLLEKIKYSLIRKINESKILKLLYKLNPNIIGFITRRNLGLQKLDFFFCGGAPLDKKTEFFFNDIGLRIYQGYGLSEASPLISVNCPNNYMIGSVGQIVNQSQIQIRKKDKEGNGIIFFKGPNVFKGYYKNKVETDSVMDDGFMNTGDIGKLDKNNFLYITGRKKFVIIGPSGENIYPEEIEEQINQNIEIEESIIFSKDDKKIITIIKLKDEFLNLEDSKIKDIIENINNNNEIYKRISKIYITNDDFEKTSTQKIKRNFLKTIDFKNYIEIN